VIDLDPDAGDRVAQMDQVLGLVDVAHGGGEDKEATASLHKPNEA
jgi:hypothetical protein